MSTIDRSGAARAKGMKAAAGAALASHLDLDGHLLQLLLAVYEEASVTRAAERLGVTQSAVSHGLERLRGIVGDALFVKSGRGIAPTAAAQALAQRARVLLDDLRAFGRMAGFDPARLQLTLAVAANDLQRDLLLPPLLRRLRAVAPGVTLRVTPSGAPQPALLRDEACDLLITPRPPQGSDIYQKRLFEDRYVVFHDPAMAAAPATRREWLAAEHVTVLYEQRRPLDFDQWLTAEGHQRRVVATVPGMAALAAMVRGSPWLATAPSLLARGALLGLAMAELPLGAPPLRMYGVWHARHHTDPVMRWVREQLDAVAAEVLAEGAAAPGSPPPSPAPESQRRKPPP